MMNVVASGAISGGEGLVLLRSCTSSSTSAVLSRSSLDLYKRFHSPLSYPICKLEKFQTRGLTVRASGNLNVNSALVAPLQFVSPTGQLLAQILQTHPHLLPAAVDQQFQNLHTDRDTQTKEAPPPAQDLLLYRRIAEVREKERQKALEDIIIKP